MKLNRVLTYDIKVMCESTHTGYMLIETFISVCYREVVLKHGHQNIHLLETIIHVIMLYILYILSILYLAYFHDEFIHFS